MAHDLVIRGGLIVTATDTFVADLGIRHGRIASIADGLEPGATEIDARGLHVLPGGVDVHTHLDLDLGGTRTAPPPPRAAASRRSATTRGRRRARALPTRSPRGRPKPRTAPTSTTDSTSSCPT